MTMTEDKRKTHGSTAEFPTCYTCREGVIRDRDFLINKLICEVVRSVDQLVSQTDVGYHLAGEGSVDDKEERHEDQKYSPPGHCSDEYGD